MKCINIWALNLKKKQLIITVVFYTQWIIVRKPYVVSGFLTRNPKSKSQKTTINCSYGRKNETNH